MLFWKISFEPFTYSPESLALFGRIVELGAFGNEFVYCGIVERRGFLVGTPCCRQQAEQCAKIMSDIHNGRLFLVLHVFRFGCCLRLGFIETAVYGIGKIVTLGLVRIVFVPHGQGEAPKRIMSVLRAVS